MRTNHSEMGARVLGVIRKKNFPGKYRHDSRGEERRNLLTNHLCGKMFDARRTGDGPRKRLNYFGRGTGTMLP